MNEDKTEPHLKSSPGSQDETSPGVKIRSRQDVNVSGDIAGRDVVKNTTNTTTNVGFSIDAVQRLVIAVGLMVFITAACFFSGGVAVGGVALAALNKQVGSSEDAAASMQAKLSQIRTLGPGVPFQFTFTEDEISSYLRFIAGPPMGVSDGKVRLLEPGKLVMGGQSDQLGGLPFAATFEVQYNTPGQPLRLTGAAIQLLKFGKSNFGWVVVPTPFLQSVADEVNASIGAGYELSNITDASHGADLAWTADGVTR
jgi:hypothetical protein